MERGRTSWTGWDKSLLFLVIKCEFDLVSNSPTWMCLICGWIYDEAAGDPDHGLPAGMSWADVPMNWVCPECGARKDDFEMIQV
jgi:rubredoxin